MNNTELYTKIKNVSKAILEEKRYFLNCRYLDLRCQFCEESIVLSTKTVFQFYLSKSNIYHYGIFCNIGCVNLWILQNNV